MVSRLCTDVHLTTLRMWAANIGSCGFHISSIHMCSKLQELDILCDWSTAMYKNSKYYLICWQQTARIQSTLRCAGSKLQKLQINSDLLPF